MTTKGKVKIFFLKLFDLIVLGLWLAIYIGFIYITASGNSFSFALSDIFSFVLVSVYYWSYSYLPVHVIRSLISALKDRVIGFEKIRLSHGEEKALAFKEEHKQETKKEFFAFLLFAGLLSSLFNSSDSSSKKREE